MIIGWHTYEPGLHSVGAKTSAGGAVWTRRIWSFLESYGHMVVDLSVPGRDPLEDVRSCDVLFMAWRWQMPRTDYYADRNAARDTQMKLLDMANVPIIIHDEDLQVTPGELRKLRSIKAILTMPALQPPYGFESLPFPYFDKDDMAEPYDERSGLVYVGNNYDRWDDATNYISGTGVHATFYGNWMEASPSGDRQSPEIVKQYFPLVEFAGRIPNEEVMGVLNRSMFTIHLSRPRYHRYAFLTYRWIEAVNAGTLALIPERVTRAQKVAWPGPIVSRESIFHTMEMLQKNDDLRQVYLEQQRQFVSSRMRPERWLQILEGAR